MGQYYRPVVKIDGKITVYNRDVDGEYTMAKLMEHSWWGNDLMDAIAKQFYKTKGQLAWVGDYAEDSETPIPMATIWDTEGEGLSKVDFTLDKKFLVNWDTKEYIDLDVYKKKSKGADGLTTKLHQTFKKKKKELTPFSHSLLIKMEEIHLNSFNETSIISNWKRYYKKRNLQTNTTYEYKCQSPYKILANFKRIRHVFLLQTEKNYLQKIYLMKNYYLK